MGPHSIYATIALILGVIGLLTNKGDPKALGLIALTTFITLEIYFAPTTIAHVNKKRNSGAIFFLNLALGWTLVGWVVAGVWAMAKEEVIVTPTQASKPMEWKPLPGEVKPEPETRDCPFCAEPIKIAAIKCKHCGSDLTTA